MELSELTKKLKAATGPDRVLDALIAIACDVPRPAWANDTGTLVEGCDTAVLLSPDGPGWYPANYTASIEAALKLLPEWSYWVIGHGQTRESEPMGGAQIFHPEDDINPLGEAEAETVPLAICIAALQARNPLPLSQ